LIVRTALFIGTVENIEVEVINVIADKDVSDEFQDRRLSDTSLANKKDGVCVYVFRCFDDPPLKGLNVTRKYVKTGVPEMSP